MRLRYDRWLKFWSPDHNITPALELMLSHMDMSINHNTVNSSFLRNLEDNKHHLWFELSNWRGDAGRCPHHVVSVWWLLRVLCVRSEPGLAPRCQGQSLHNWDPRAKQIIWGPSKLFYALSVCWTTALMLHIMNTMYDWFLVILWLRSFRFMIGRSGSLWYYEYHSFGA
jgi:hypothetical protein